MEAIVSCKVHSPQSFTVSCCQPRPWTSSNTYVAIVAIISELCHLGDMEQHIVELRADHARIASTPSHCIMVVRGRKQESAPAPYTLETQLSAEVVCRQ